MLLLILPAQARAAIGCTLSNPAQDLKYLFPEMTTYKEEARELNKMKDGPELFKKLRDRLGSDLDPVYEKYDTPYTVYSVFKGNDLIGIVHGVNVPGKGGVILARPATIPRARASETGRKAFSAGALHIHFLRLAAIARARLRNSSNIRSFSATGRVANCAR